MYLNEALELSTLEDSVLSMVKVTGLPMLRITTEQKRGKLILSVEGRLAGQWVTALEQCWRELRTSSPQGKFSVNLCGVSYIDAAGKVLLKEIHQQGGHLLAEGCLNQAIVREIVGAAGAEKSASEGEQTPAKAKKSHIIFYLFFLGLAVGTSGVRAQDAPARPHQPRNALSASAPTGVLRLTLDEAVHLAVKQNPTAQIAVIQALESVEDKNVARAALLPEIDGSVK